MTTESTTPRQVAESSATMSRRAVLGSVAAFATATVIVAPASSRAQQKVSKQAAQYRESPNGVQNCAGCRFFIQGGSCQLVEGKIGPNGWCKLFQPTV